MRAVSANIRPPAFLEESEQADQLDSFSSLISAKQWASASDSGRCSFAVEILPDTLSFGDRTQFLRPAGTLLT
jgi:hypothetical protein